MPDGTAIYHRRQPEKTVFYQIIQQYFSQWQSDYPYRHQETLPYYIEDEFKRFIKCGILSEGFARVRCAECSHDYIVAFSCKRRAACPSCCAKYREYTVQHLLDEVLPKVPMRQIVLSLPKWIRFYVARDSEQIGGQVSI